MLGRDDRGCGRARRRHHIRKIVERAYITEKVQLYKVLGGGTVHGLQFTVHSSRLTVKVLDIPRLHDQRSRYIPGLRFRFYNNKVELTLQVDI